jgi:hypothetical protein
LPFAYVKMRPKAAQNSANFGASFGDSSPHL